MDDCYFDGIFCDLKNGLCTQQCTTYEQWKESLQGSFPTDKDD